MATTRFVLLVLLLVLLLVGEGTAPLREPGTAFAALARLPSSAPAGASPSGTWITPFFEDGQSPGEYTFLSILNAGTAADMVTVSFYNKTGTLITNTANTIAAGEAWQLLTGTAGGVSATTGGSGWIKIQGSGASLVPSGFVFLPNAGNYPGFSLPFYTP